MFMEPGIAFAWVSILFQWLNKQSGLHSIIIIITD